MAMTDLCLAMAHPPADQLANAQTPADALAILGRFYDQMRDAAPANSPEFDASFELAYDWQRFLDDSAASQWDPSAVRAAIAADVNTAAWQQSAVVLQAYWRSRCIGAGPGASGAPDTSVGSSSPSEGSDHFNCVMGVVDSVETDAIGAIAAGRNTVPHRDPQVWSC